MRNVDQVACIDVLTQTTYVDTPTVVVVAADASVSSAHSSCSRSLQRFELKRTEKKSVRSVQIFFSVGIYMYTSVLTRQCTPLGRH